jgi:hypothetical protein
MLIRQTATFDKPLPGLTSTIICTPNRNAIHNKGFAVAAGFYVEAQMPSKPAVNVFRSRLGRLGRQTKRGASRLYKPLPSCLLRQRANIAVIKDRDALGVIIKTIPANQDAG